MGVRIIHTADWQLGKRFRFIPGDAGALVREQRFDTVRRVGELAISHKADLIIVAGDVFEMNTVDDLTLRRVCEVLGQFSVPWLLLPGNHDPSLAQSAWSRLGEMGLPDNVRLLLTPEPILLDGLGLAVLPAPLTAKHTAEDLTDYFDRAETPEGCIRVGVAHGSVTNRLPARSEAQNPVSDTRADSAKLDYLALGDWHGTLQIAPRTWYSGTPEPDRFHNNDAGNVLLVEIEAPGTEPNVERLPVGHYRWKELTTELHDAHDLESFEATLDKLEGNPEESVVSIKLSGTLDLGTRAELQQLLNRHRARVRFMRVNDEALQARPTEADLDRIGRTGFVADALDRLRAIAQDTDHPDHQHAQSAIQLLYAEHQRDAQS